MMGGSELRKSALFIDNKLPGCMPLSEPCVGFMSSVDRTVGIIVLCKRHVDRERIKFHLFALLDIKMI